MTTLTGDKAIIAQTLNKIELAVRRSATRPHLFPADAFETLADEILRVTKELHYD